ncbi:DNA repair protein Rad52/59/22 [uncultured Caudovirales phage]|uniref:DNA repair protein Rad52/59/22 n=1 Tax=uncultured Caudovirales phage TaxID=2100421 RepID=A0A6J5MCL0_9CAUD|nr:DNA repair protein Rad52/59/22 [uncultured Caudovirales phage]CAB4189243.1 DNA repair protein Rad52/59/22 [uncultured Caudovirales phage]
MSKDIASALLAPFEEKDLKHRPGRAGMTFTYADARAVAQRLDDVLGIEGWQFEVKVADGARNVVHGSLAVVIGGKTTIRQDFGYPNSAQDDEPLKSAASDALRRCAAQLGVGRSLYSPDKGVPVPLGRVAPRSVAPTPLSVDSGEALTDDQTLALKAAMVFADSAGGETCSHGTEWVLKPGGVSKVSGKPYGPFYTASHKTPDGGWCKDKPSREFLASHPTEEPKPRMVPEDLSELPF